MRITTVDAHVAGAPVRLIVGGWPRLAGRSFATRVQHMQRRHDHLRHVLTNEPRGHRAMTAAVLVEPSAPGAHAGLAFMHASGWTPFCGHAVIGAAGLARRLGLVHTADGTLVVETMAGTCEVRCGTPGIATPAGEGASPVAYVSPPAWLVQAGVRVALSRRAVSLDLAWSQGLFAFVDAEIAGAPPDLGNEAALVSAATQVARALHEVVLPSVPASVRALEGIVFVAPPAGGEDVRSATVYGDGVVDRSPGGSCTAALVAVLDRMGMVPEDRPLLHAGPCGTFAARVVARTHSADDGTHIVAEIEATPYLTGEHSFVLYPGDPLVADPTPLPRRRRQRPVK